MKRILISLVLLSLIILSFGYSGIKFLSQDTGDNFFNLKYRDKFASYEFLRRVLNLRFDGDAKSDFLGKKKLKVLIEVDSAQGATYSQSALDELRDKIAQITGKETTYLISDQNIPLLGSADQKTMEETINFYRDFQNMEDVASLYILYAGNSVNESEIGSTFMESGIIIFVDALEELISPQDKNYSLFEYSTLLHEFGHQLGLGHNDIEGCLMNQDVEVGGVIRTTNIVTDFCEFEIGQILEIKLNT
jgi:predicted Zn-dependent protease